MALDKSGSVSIIVPSKSKIIALYMLRLYQGKQKVGNKRAIIVLRRVIQLVVQV